MATKVNHTQSDTFYFITITCYKLLSLFETANIFEYFPEWTQHLSTRGITLSGYVIMPNHMHLLVYVHSSNKGLNKTLGNFKRFLAYEIVKRLKRKKKFDTLRTLEMGVRKEERLKGKKHQVFQPSFDAKEVRGDNDIAKVLDYIHHNPVSKKWRLVNDFVTYPYSSAQFYYSDISSTIKVVDYRDVFDYTPESSKE